MAFDGKIKVKLGKLKPTQKKDAAPQKIDWSRLQMNPAVRAAPSGLSQSTRATISSEEGKKIRSDLLSVPDYVSGAVTSLPSRAVALAKREPQPRLETMTEQNIGGLKEAGLGGAALPIGIALSVLGDPLNFITGGASGVAKLSKLLSKTDDVAESYKILRSAGFADDIAESRAPIYTAEKDTAKIEKLLNSDAALQSKTKAIPQQRTTAGRLTKQVIKDETGLASAPRIAQTERTLLRQKFQAQAKGADEALTNIRVVANTSKGARFEEAAASLSDVTKRAIQILKDKYPNIAAKKQAITDYAKDKLPIEVRGRLLSAVNTATTEGEVSQAFQRINKLRNEEVKAEVVSEIEKMIDVADTLPPNQREKVSELVGELTTESFSKATQAKLTALREFMAEQPESIFNFGPKTLKKAEKSEALSKKKVSDLPIRDLFKIRDNLEHQLDMGKLYGKTVGDIKVLRVDNAINEIQKGSRNLDEGLPPPRKPGETDVGSKFAGAYNSTRESIREGVQYYATPDVGFQILDNEVERGANWRIFKRPMDAATDLANEMRNELVDDLFKTVSEIQQKFGKLTRENYEKVMIYATLKQVGGKEKLMRSDPRLYTESFLEGFKELSEGEMIFYKKGREIFDALRPHVEDVFWKTRGEKLGKVDNYWSWMTDFDNSDELFQRIAGDYHTRSRTEQSFTKSRSLVGTQSINLSALDVLVKHISDTSDFIHKEELLNHLSKIAKSEKYGTAVGKLGQKWVAGWLDLIARGGTPKGFKPSIITTVVRNIGHGVLGFRLSPIVKQPLAKVVSVGLLGKDALVHDAQFFTNPSIREAIQNISKQQRFRNFDDPTYTALAKSKKLAQWQQWGYLGIKTFDSWTADSVWYAAYRKKIKEGGTDFSFSLDDFLQGKNLDQDAVEYADLIVRRTQGSSEYKDAPMMYNALADKNGVMAFLQFQRFIHIQSLLWRDAKVALSKEKDPVKAASIAMSLVAAGIAESYVSTGMSQIFAKEDYAKEQREKPIADRLFNVLTGQIPVISNLTSIAEYGGSGVPVWDIAVRQPMQGLDAILTGKSPETKMRGATRIAEGVGSALGVSGSGQVAQILRKFIPEAGATSSGRPSSLKIKAPKLNVRKIKVPR